MKKLIFVLAFVLIASKTAVLKADDLTPAPGGRGLFGLIGSFIAPVTDKIITVNGTIVHPKPVFGAPTMSVSITYYGHSQPISATVNPDGTFTALLYVISNNVDPRVWVKCSATVRMDGKTYTGSSSHADVMPGTTITPVITVK